MMSYYKYFMSILCISLWAAQGALADVTPEQVWENLQTQWKGYGYEIEAQSTAREGEVLVVKGIKATAGLGGDKEIKAILSLDHMTLTDKGDGSVVVTQADNIAVEVLTGTNAGTPDAKPDKADGQIAIPGMEVAVSGTPEAMIYDYAVPNMGARINVLSGAENVTMSAMIKGLKAHSAVSGDVEKLIEGNGTADKLALILIADGGDYTRMNYDRYELSGLTLESKNKLVGDMANLGAALKAGSVFEGKIAYASFTGNVYLRENIVSMMDFEDKGGEINYVFDAQKVAYDTNAHDGTVTMSGPFIPMREAVISYKESRAKMLIPLSKSDTASDFSIAQTWKELAIDEKLWARVDKGGKLPHDPMSFALDVSGKLSWNVDIFDQKATAALQGAPVTLESVKLNDLSFSAVGVNVTGKGDVTFDNSDMTSFDGMPAPTGQVDFKAVGVNKLIDTLVEMGFVPADQAMGARMMMGMFAKPVEGEEDTLSSVVEFKDKGMFVNGAQMK